MPARFAESNNVGAAERADHDDDRRLGIAGIGADGLRDLDAVLARHLPIHQHDVERCARRPWLRGSRPTPRSRNAPP